MNYIKKLQEITLQDVPLVGGKTASLGEMIRTLSSSGFRVPDGFAITAKAYWHYLDANHLREKIDNVMQTLPDSADEQQLQKVGKEIRALFMQGTIPEDLKQEIIVAYKQLSKEYNERLLAVAVRSSATAEDLPGASFAGQQETFLHIKGIDALLQACKGCLASLFTDRAIVYRISKNFDYRKIALTIAVQKMVRSDKACSGVGFSLDTETGFKDVIILNASYGLGEAIVQGQVTPDEYHLFKPTLKEGYVAIIAKKVGGKEKKLVYGKTQEHPTMWKKVVRKEQNQFCLTDEEILELGKSIMLIEEHYSELHQKWTPMDVEWAKDGNDGLLYILQARPETVHALENKSRLFEQTILKTKNPKIILQGQSIGQKIAQGKVKVIDSIQQFAQFAQGDVLVTIMTDPDWLPLLKKASAIITDSGGRTCHAAIVSRELGIPALIGTKNATKILQNNAEITVDCSQGSTGYVYEGAVAFDVEKIDITALAKPPVDVMVNLGDPAQAFSVSQLPYLSGVGLARLEFIIASSIQVHPMACIHDEMIVDKKVQKKIRNCMQAFSSGKDFFVDTLSYGIAMIAAAFYPKPVLVRFSDFKTNEYRNLLGGSYFEPEENNPMLGLRGASRYYSSLYQEAFALECAALKKVRDEIGLTNVIAMIPFVRTMVEAENVISSMKKNGLKQSLDGLRVYMMLEIPSNVMLIDQFCALFDGFSIGSNDLTQFTLAVDRDSSVLADLFDERDQAVKKMISLAIAGALKHKKPIGVCGQAPSDYPEMAEFFIDEGVTSLSLNPDAVLPFLLSLNS